MSQQPMTAGVIMIDVKVGQTIRLESVDFGEITLTMHAKDGQRVRLGLKAGKNVTVHRPPRSQAR